MEKLGGEKEKHFLLPMQEKGAKTLSLFEKDPIYIIFFCKYLSI
jgi:hypothetical protein